MAVFQELCIRRAREDFSAFCEYCFTDKNGKPWVTQWFHEEWDAAAMDDDEHQTQIASPRSHAKTERMAVAYPIWRLGHDHDLRIKIVCEDDPLAIKRLKAIRRHIAKNPRVHEVFPDLRRDDKEAWSETQLFVDRDIIDKDPSVEAKGIFSGVTGARVDLLIADDICGKRNTLLVPASMPKVILSWEDDWLNLCEPTETKIIYLCTLWHRKDCGHKLMANEAWHTIFHAVGPGFQSIWPVRWGEAALRARHALQGSTAFARGFLNQCRAESDQKVRPGWILYTPLEDMPPLNELVIITSYDPAKETKAGSDFTAEVVGAVHEASKRIYILDASRQKITRDRQAHWVYRSAIKYQPWRIAIEDIGNDLALWVETDHPELLGLVERIHPHISKAQRLEDESPLLERGQVVFSDRLDPESPLFKTGRGDLVTELLEFPYGEHDDVVDALSQLLKVIRFYLLDPRNRADDTMGTGVVVAKE